MLAALAGEARADGNRIVVWGPFGTMIDLVACAARSSAERLVNVVAGPELSGEPARCDLTTVAQVAAEWAETYAALRAVEAYSFDPVTDHVRP